MQTSDIDFLHFTEIDSTNEKAKRLFHAGDLKSGRVIVITADMQSAGKGTQGRSWVSPAKSGITMSVLHVPDAENAWPLSDQYTMAAGVACAEALQKILNLTVQLKPVNDLYVDGRKLGGILTESMIQENRLQALITGIGINVRDIERPLPETDQRGVTPVSLEEVLPPHVFERFLTDELVRQIAISLDSAYASLRNDGSDGLRETYESHAIQLKPML